MRKPLIALSLAFSTGFGVIPVAGVLAAPASAIPLGTHHSTTSNRLAPLSTPLAATRSGNSVSGAAIVQTAMKYLGYPYSLTGASPATGFSCIGFVSYVYRQNGIALPGDLGDALRFAPQVPFSQLEPGDILYFQNTVWPGLSHAAIYVGGGRFIHSEYFGIPLHISSFKNDPRDGNYWSEKYLGANRPWGGAASVPLETSGPSAGTATAPNAGVAPSTISGTPAIVGGRAVHVRFTPSMQGGIETVLAAGTAVTIIGQRGGWYHVQLASGETGWIIRSGLNRGSAALPGSSATKGSNAGLPSAPARTGAPSAIRSHSSVAIRVGLRVHVSPGLRSRVISTVARGTQVQVLGRSGGWVKIRTAGGVIGWVDASYTSAVRTGSANPSTYNSYAYHPAKRIARRVARRRAARSAARLGTYRTGPVLTAGVRVHSGPGLRTRVIGLAAAGTHVRMIGSTGSWDRIHLATGLTGYVYGIYVRA